MFEDSKWIAKEEVRGIKPAPLFRKTFIAEGEVDRAELGVCGLGLGYYFINGKNITDELLSPPVSKYDSRVYYSTYDVTAFIQNGVNAVGAILGNGCYYFTGNRWDYSRPYWMHHPKMLLELKIYFKDGRTKKVVSDTSWRCADSAVIYNETKKGETFDARLYDKNWSTVNFDDSQWGKAFICRSPGGILAKMEMPPIRVTKTYPAKYIGNGVYDLGQNISGWVRITAKGERGTKITIKYSELIHEDGSINPEQNNSIVGSETHIDRYIMSGDGVECWAPCFSYHGFRYVEVMGAPDEFSVVGELLHTDFAKVGDFVCSDEMVNKIHNASVMSTLTNFHGLPTDCPHREQNGWTGDALLSSDQMLINFDAVSAYKKWLIDIRDTQRPSGQICAIAPTGGWGYNWGTGPNWDSVLIFLPYLIYRYTGDMSVMQEMWDSMVAYMRFIESMSDKDIVCFGLGEWSSPQRESVCPTEIIDTAYFYSDNRIMAHCAQLLGKNGKAYKERAARIRKSFREKFLKDNLYLDDNTTAITCAAYHGMYTPEEESKAIKRTAERIAKNGYHIDCGMFGLKYIFALFPKYGYAETVYKMVVNPEYPSYAYWINCGMTTLCETWDMKVSCNHHMFSDIDMFFYRNIAGICIDEGANSVTIKPCFIKDIEWVEASHKGVSVRIEKDKVKVKSDIPGRFIEGDRITEFNGGEYIFERKKRERH